MPELGKASSETDPLYLYIPVSRFILMSVFTFGIYSFYWIYKNWEYLNNRDNLQIHPFWRGWFGIFFCGSLLHAIHDDALLKQYRSAEFNPTNLAAGWILAGIGWRVLDRVGTGFPADYFHVIIIIIVVLFLLQIWFLVPVQEYINNANEKLRPAARHYPWSPGHFIMLGIAFVMVLMNL